MNTFVFSHHHNGFESSFSLESLSTSFLFYIRRPQYSALVFHVVFEPGNPNRKLLWVILWRRYLQITTSAVVDRSPLFRASNATEAPWGSSDRPTRKRLWEAGFETWRSPKTPTCCQATAQQILQHHFHRDSCIPSSIHTELQRRHASR